jgi:hypothetical protein
MFFYNEQDTTIVTDGLTLHLDAGDTASYPGTGTTWYDLSGNGYNGTLVNGPVHSLEKQGTFKFDGTNDHITTSLTNTSFSSANVTMEIIFNSDVVDNGTFTTLAGMRPANDDKNVIGLWIEARDAWAGNYNSNYGFIATPFGVAKTEPGTVVDNTWYHATVVSTTSEIKIYINGQLFVSSARQANFDVSTVATFGIGSFGNSVTGLQYPNNLSNQKISIVRLYEKSLSNEEVLQNFHATKDRFGL